MQFYCEVKEIPHSVWDALLVNNELAIYWICGKSVIYWFLLQWSHFKLLLLLLRFFMIFFRYSKGLLGLFKIECMLYPLQLFIHQLILCITLAVQKLLKKLWSNSCWVSAVITCDWTAEESFSVWHRHWVFLFRKASGLGSIKPSFLVLCGNSVQALKLTTCFPLLAL
jgi:hypothetical protein